MIPAFGHEPNCHFLGFPMSQNRYAIPAWSYLFEKIPPATIIEIGTSVGGMTCCLAMAAMQYHAELHTFDITPTISSETDSLLRQVFGKRVSVNIADALAPDSVSAIRKIVNSRGQATVLCDGGNKVAEFRTFASVIKAGDVIAAHDFGSHKDWPWEEIKLSDVADTLRDQGIERFMEDVFLNTGWLVCRKSQ